MGTGYTRADVTNNISNSNLVDADDLDAEFDAIVAAFNSSTGHTHDGTTAEGAPVTVLGPAQEAIQDATAFYPKTDDTYDLGKSGAEWKDIYIDGVAYIDTLDLAGGQVTSIDTDLSSVSASDNTLASAKAIKTYVDSLVTAQDLDFQADTGGALSIDLDSETLTIAGGTGIDTSGSSNTVTIAIDSTVATLTDTQTLENKTVESSAIESSTIDSSVIGGSTPAAGTFTTLAANTSLTDDKGVTGGVIPVGGIILWSGAVSAVPSGWNICDGTNGTPDLTGRFVVHADADSGGTYDVGDTGGSDTVTLLEANLPSHTHTFSGNTGNESSGHTHAFSGTTNTVGDHTHSIPDGSGIDGVQALEAGSVIGTIQSGAAGAHSHTFSGNTSNVSNNHTHSFSGTTGSTGSGSAVENRPPYYALAYIMRVA